MFPVFHGKPKLTHAVPCVPPLLGRDHSAGQQRIPAEKYVKQEPPARCRCTRPVALFLIIRLLCRKRRLPYHSCRNRCWPPRRRSGHLPGAADPAWSRPPGGGDARRREACRLPAHRGRHRQASPGAGAVSPVGWGEISGLGALAVRVFGHSASGRGPPIPPMPTSVRCTASGCRRNRR